MEQFIEFVIKNWYLFAALAVIVALLVGGEIMRKVRGVTGVTPNQALQLMNDGDAVVLDIREIGEFKDGHIPGAQNMSMGALKDRLGELEKFKGKPMVVYCGTGTRSQSACNLLKKNGYDSVHNLTGGLAAWRNASLPTKKK